MMKPLPLIALMAALAGCGNTTNPLFETEGHDGGVLPGTEVPRSSRGISRYEPDDPESQGGYVRSVAFNRASDTITVDGLAFDGDNTYERGGTINNVSSANGYRVYEADVTVPDFLDDSPVVQIQQYRAIVGRSANVIRETTTGANGETITTRQPRTEFTIVRTGGYLDFGYGGFFYERRGGVVLPNRGQAGFEGNYAGLRVFDGLEEIQYVHGDMELQIDYVGFGNGPTIKAQIFNRDFFDIDGNQLPEDDNPSDGICAGCTVDPIINFVITPDGDMFDENGEATGEVLSSFIDVFGDRVNYEEGNFYLIMSGDMTDPDDGGEIVGIITVEAEDPRFGFYDGGGNGSAIMMQETGGFILYRDPDAVANNE